MREWTSRRHQANWELATMGIGNIATMAAFACGAECCQCESVASTNCQFPMREWTPSERQANWELATMGIGNIVPMATFAGGAECCQDQFQ